MRFSRKLNFLFPGRAKILKMFAVFQTYCSDSVFSLPEIEEHVCFFQTIFAEGDFIFEKDSAQI